MKKKVLKFLQDNNIINEKEVNSLFVSLFISEKKIKVERNLLILDLVNYNFNNKNSLTDELLKITREEKISIDLEFLIQLFEFVISPATRIVNGAVYTPENIRQFIINSTIDECVDNASLVDFKIADLSCGCGAFLIDIAKKIKKRTSQSYESIFEKNIYGIDIENYAIERAKILLSLLAIKNGEDRDFQFNLLSNNALTFNWCSYISSFSGFDIIVGNPPYVAAKHMSEDTRKQLSNMKTCRIGNPDLYIPFFEVGIDNLADNGKLGFITMNSFFKSLNARNLRSYFRYHSLNFKIIDFSYEQIFLSRNTYTCICIIKKSCSDSIEYIRTKSKNINEELKFDKVLYSNLDSYNGWNLYFNDIIRKIESTGTPLGEKYKTSHGLATLKNEIYIFTPVRETHDTYFLLTRDGKEYEIEKSICMTVINSNKLSREHSFDKLEEKLIFPYTKKDKTEILSEEELINYYPLTYKYLFEQKHILLSRDKGKGKYQTWYAYGRTQSLEQNKYKMFFPKYSDVTPHYLIHDDKETYFYNGQAFLSNSIKELKILKKLLETKLFWFYISSTSKPYASGYYSLNGIYIKKFGICTFTKEEIEFVLEENNSEILEDFFQGKYNVSIK